MIEKHFIIALFDDESTMKLQKLKAEMGIDTNNAHIYPHITLAVYDKNISSKSLIQWAAEFSKRQVRTDVYMSAVGIFNAKTLVGVVRFSRELYKLYYELHEKYDEYCAVYSSVNFARGWFPHISLFHGDCVEIKTKIDEFLSISFEELTLKTNAICVSVMKDSKTYILKKFQLEANE